MENKNKKAYIIGGGIAGLSAAVFLIKDGGLKGENIFILEQNKETGGSFDGRSLAKKGFSSKGYRMFEKSIYTCTFDLLSKIPSPENMGETLKDDFFEFNKKIKVRAKARLVKNGKIINAHKLELNWQDRFALVKLLFLPEIIFGTQEIRQYFTPSFFETNFWFEWSTTFAFKPWHSLVEMKRYLERFIQESPHVDTMSCFLAAPYCEHDFFILPTINWLKENNVNFKIKSEVSDIEFVESNGKKTAGAILLKNKKKKIIVGEDDLVFLTNGSMTAGNSSPFDVWKNISGKAKNFGNPDVFFNSPKKSQWESFTITFNNEYFFKLVEKFSGNKAGTGGLITFKDSNWFLSIILPSQPYFLNQPKNTFVCWGYGSASDVFGNYIKKKMSDCTGKEILQEICCHLGFENEMQEILKTAVVVPVLMPYITSQFLPRKKSDRPEVVPAGSQNFAFLGQYVEIPNEIVFTVECSVRSAKMAVKKLLDLSGELPALYQKKYKPKTLLNAIKTILR